MEYKEDRNNFIAERIVTSVLPIVLLVVVILVASCIIISCGIHAHEELSFAIARDIYKQGTGFSSNTIPINTLEGFPWWVMLIPFVGAIIVLTIDKCLFKASNSLIIMSSIIALALSGLVVVATLYGYYMRDLRSAVEHKYTDGNKYWCDDDNTEPVPSEIADLV